MKILKYCLIVFFISSASYASKLDDYIKLGDGNKINLDKKNINDTLQEFSKSTQKEIVEKIEENIDNLTKKYDQEIEKATNRINNNIIKKGEELVNDASVQYGGLINTKNTIVSIINKLPIYLIILKVVISFLLLVLFIMLFLLFQINKKVKILQKILLETKK